jgi:hypothetical protein
MKPAALGYFCLSIIICGLSACSKDSTTGNYPLISPPVKSAAPAGFQSRSRTLSTSEFSSRFFTTGPTSIFRILDSIDTRITDINSRVSSSTSGCYTATPVNYTLSILGSSVDMYAQCYEILSGATATDPKLLQWGKKGDVFYLYEAVGAERVVAIATPITGTTNYRVQAWIAVGFTNSTCAEGQWDTCSYGVIQVDADSDAATFEMTVAGMGFGYCGAQLKSDGTNVYATGSTDMGSTCNAVDTLCVTAANVSTTGTCGSSLTTFALTPMGRKLASGSGAGVAAVTTWAASLYPASANVTLDGTSTDDLHFGITTPTTGVLAF